MTKQEMVKKSTYAGTNVVSLDSYRKMYDFAVMKGDIKPSDHTVLLSKKFKSDKDRQKELAKKVTKPR